MTDPAKLTGWRRRNWLISAANRVKTHRRDNGLYIAQLGELLLVVKKVTRRGSFRLWVKKHFDGSLTLAREYMRFARISKFIEKSALRSLLPSSIRLLAKKNLPKRLLSKTLERLKTAEPTGYNKLLDAIFKTDERISDNQETPADEPEEAPEARLWRLLESLVSASDMVHFSVCRDESCPTVGVTVYSETGSKSASRATVAECVEAATGTEPTRTCAKCKQAKTLQWFAKATTYCRICERERVKSYG